MNKKGFLRIVEASIAIILIIGVLFVFYSKYNYIFFFNNILGGGENNYYYLTIFLQLETINK